MNNSHLNRELLSNSDVQNNAISLNLEKKKNGKKGNEKEKKILIVMKHNILSITKRQNVYRWDDSRNFELR